MRRKGQGQGQGQGQSPEAGWVWHVVMMVMMGVERWGGLIRGCRDETGDGCDGGLAGEIGIFLLRLGCLCFEAVRRVS